MNRKVTRKIDKTNTEVLTNNLVYYCKNCQKLINPKKVGKRNYTFKCPECGKKDVAYGTMKSIKTFYNIKE